jgi:NADH-quinone oxidoreductase subunit E
MADDIKILVVDDETVVRRSCMRILEAEGYKVEVASGGREAILTMEKNPYDFVITDLKMPEVDGLTLIKWTRKSRPETGIAVLIDVVSRAVEWKKDRVPAEEKKEEEFPPSMIAELDRMIKSYRSKLGSLIPVLQRAQEMVGYLPPIVQKRISRGLNIPTAEVHSVVSFYSFFTMKPRGDHIIKICLGTACYVKGIEEVLGKIKDDLKLEVGDITEDKRFSLEAVRCLGACGLAPVMVVDHDTHGAVTSKKVLQILDEYKTADKPR